ncbi:hypothetical protein ACFLQ0_06125 [Nitrospinota bacterium]
MNRAFWPWEILIVARLAGSTGPAEGVDYRMKENAAFWLRYWLESEPQRAVFRQT